MYAQASKAQSWQSVWILWLYALAMCIALNSPCLIQHAHNFPVMTRLYQAALTILATDDEGYVKRAEGTLTAGIAAVMCHHIDYIIGLLHWCKASAHAMQRFSWSARHVKWTHY